MRDPDIQNLHKMTGKDREKAILAAGRSADASVVSLKANGAEITDEVRDALLKKCANSEYVELEIDILAYEQKDGERNRNFVRLRNGSIMEGAKTGSNTPFLRDHDHYNTLATGGKIVSSRGEKRGEGDYAIHQKAKLTAPWAVDLALRGLLNTVSVSWVPTGKVTCSACKSQVLTSCWHWPGDKLKASVSEADGKTRLLRDRTGDIVVEWVYDSFTMVETSAVIFPAVAGAHIEGIRASLSATNQLDDTQPENPPMSEPTIDTASLTAKLNRALKIAEFSDAAKLHFKRLDTDGQEAFLAKSAADRLEEMKPVWTSKSGVSFTSADDPRVIEMAKNSEKESERYEKLLGETKLQSFVTRADTELAHLSGTVEQRAALLQAIDSISDPEIRTAILASIKDYDAGQGKKFVRQGVGGAAKPGAANGDPEVKLNTLVKEHMKTTGDDEDAAMAAVMSTAEGVRLYGEMDAANKSQPKTAN